MKILTTAEVAAILRVSDEYVRQLCDTKQLRAKKVGKEWRIRAEAVDEFLDDGEKTTTPRPGRMTKKQRIAVAQRGGQVA